MTKSKDKKKIELFYIGSDFYQKSFTAMSSLYVVGTWERYDWGFVNVALDKGYEVNIRPANKKEMSEAYKLLKYNETQR